LGKIHQREKDKFCGCIVFIRFNFTHEAFIVIPLTVLLFKKFVDFSIKKNCALRCFLVTVIAVCYIFFHNAPDFDVFLKHNPFAIQEQNNL
jgi:hypothetical protein